MAQFSHSVSVVNPQSIAAEEIVAPLDGGRGDALGGLCVISAPPTGAGAEPRMGYNHNFRYGGRLFHVQTEDSGPTHGHIHSHIFCAGAVVASRKTEYDRTRPPLHTDIVALMRHSHREMCRALRDGQYDENIAALTSRPPPVARRRHRTSSSVPAVSSTRSRRRSRTMEAVVPEAVADAATLACLAGLERDLTGLVGAAMVSRSTGVTVRAPLSSARMDAAAAGNIELLRTKMRLLEQLDLGGSLEDILITLEHWFCVIRPLDDDRFLYVIVDRAQGNLAMARRVVLAAVA